MKTVSVFLRVVGEVEGPVRGTLRRVATELTTFFDLALSFEQSADFADVEVFLRGDGESHNKGEVAVDGSSSVLKTLDDDMVLNRAFLVSRANEPQFDARMRALSESQEARMVFRYIGPVPPYNFVQLRADWQMGAA
jgi:hypothetical protein